MILPSPTFINDWKGWAEKLVQALRNPDPLNFVEELTLQNSWVVYSSDYLIRAVKYGSVVNLQGVIKDGIRTQGTILTRIPIGFRSVQILQFSIGAENGHASVYLDTAGDLRVITFPGSGWISLSGVCFVADA